MRTAERLFVSLAAVALSASLLAPPAAGASEPGESPMPSPSVIPSPEPTAPPTEPAMKPDEVLERAPGADHAHSVAPVEADDGTEHDHEEHSGPTETLTIEPWDEPLPFPDRPTARAAGPPAWQLPFEAGQAWSAGGPHRDSDGVAWGALDFSPGSSANRRVVAVADGRVYRVVCPNGWFLGVDHGGGWRSEYYHLEGAQEHLIGSWVPVGTYLGQAGNSIPCGGRSNGPHVHLSILYGTPPQPGHGQRPYYPVDGMRFGSYTVRAGAAVQQGAWYDSAGNVVFRNWGCCLRSTTPAPQHFTVASPAVIGGTVAVGQTLTATVPAWQPTATPALQWRRDGVALAGQTSASYTVTKSDRGARLSVTVTGTRPGTWPLTRESAAVEVPTPVSRIGGADRYATAAMMSAATFAPGGIAYVATGADFPDALAAAAAAGSAKAPVLLTATHALPASTAGELARLQPRRIIVVGGADVVSDAIVAQLHDFAPDVARVGGEDRYDTAAAVSRERFAPFVPIAYLATGVTFPDALSAAAPAATAGGPVLLTATDVLPEAIARELTRLRPERVVVLGGPVAVSDAVVRAVRNTGAADVSRLAGADRYATASMIAAQTATSPTDRVFVASGENYPDALAGAAAAGAVGSPLLITTPWRLPAFTADRVAALAPLRITVVGGESAVPNSVARALAVHAR